MEIPARPNATPNNAYSPSVTTGAIQTAAMLENERDLSWRKPGRYNITRHTNTPQKYNGHIYKNPL